jgi:hypothetical protein
MLSKDVKDSGVIHVDFGEKIGRSARLEWLDCALGCFV